MDSLRQLQLLEKEMLEIIVKICDENNIKYYMMGGTFLGAVRHKGFIPWDDDIDIAMQREDYERFLKIAPNELPEEIKLNYYKTNPKDTISEYALKVENKNFKVKSNISKNQKIINIWIDIFPLDGMPNNIILRKIHKLKLLYRRLMLRYSQFSVITNQRMDNRPIHEKVLLIIGKIFNFEKRLNNFKCLEKLDKELKKYSVKDSKYIVNFMGAYKFKEMFPKNIYDDIDYYDFEDLKLSAPKNYDFVLTQLYGDYMSEPKNKEHHYIEIIK